MSTAPSAEATGPLPSGTVTFVFTDIEGSTLRWERHRAEMERAVRRHDEVMRRTLSAHGGHVFKTIGDAFCAAFARPADAVAAVIDAQHALVAEDFSAIDGLPVRAAIHSGTADEREGDYFGPAVNRVARLLAIAHGGQVLISGVTSDLVQGDLPARASLRDLGEHRLRDLARPEYVYQLIAPGLTAEFPPLRSLDVLPNNLPFQFTSFVGREEEIAEITALIAQHRLVTLVGSGGVGKTRTSLQVAANLLDGSGDGVWFVELAPLTSGDYIPSTVMQAMGIAPPADGDALGNLVRALRSKRALLVFDNCEHLVDPAAHVIATILRGCPNIKVLASSRQGLGIAAEETYRLPSLSLPAASTGQLDAGRALDSAAVALFVERARSVDKRFVLTDEHAPAVVAICRQLDGIPLAIELAASRVKILSPSQLRERLNERFRVLTGGNRDVLPRQQTLRALIDWSYDLLEEREAELFRRLGIFVNGFTLEGAAAVGTGGEVDELDVFDLLASLVDKSLVLAEQDGAALRYRLLESTRVYALEKLSRAGQRDLLIARHLAYLVDLFAQLHAVSEQTGGNAELLETFERELEDVRAALDGALERGDVAHGAALLIATGNAWKPTGLRQELADRTESYLRALPAGERRLRAMVGWLLAESLDSGGSKLPALERARAAEADARASHDEHALASALGVKAWCAIRCDHIDEAEAALTELDALPQLLRLRLRTLNVRGFVAKAKGDGEMAVRLYEQALKEWRAAGNTSEAVITAVGLAETEHECGRTQRAVEIAREILASKGDRQVERVKAHLYMNLAGYEAALGNLAAAFAAASTAIARLPVDVARIGAGIAIEHLALVHALRGDLKRAALLSAYAGSSFERHGFVREFTERASFERVSALLGEGLDPVERVRWTAEGAALDIDAAIALALDEPRWD